MKKELKNYFNNLKGKNLPMHSYVFCEDGESIRENKNGDEITNKYNFYNYFMKENQMVVKTDFYTDEWPVDSIIEIASGDYFNSVGVPSVEAYPLIIRQSNPAYGGNKNLYKAIATHDVRALKDLDVCLAADVVGFSNKSVGGFNSWDVVKSPRYKYMLLNIMTEECFNDWINLFLADKLGTYSDRNSFNYFFYKKKGSSKWEGVIAIDNARTQLGEVAYTPMDYTAKKYCLLKQPFRSYTPLRTSNLNSHEDNIYQINEMIESGKFTESQIELIKKALEYPYAENMRDICEEYGFFGQDLYEWSSRLWEYNRQNLIVK